MTGADASSPLSVGDGVRLRPFDPDAAPDELLRELLAIYDDPETVRMVDGPDAAPYDMDKLLRMYRHLADRGELYLVELRSDDRWRAVGDVTLAHDTIPIVLDRSVRGRGIGRQVIERLVLRARDLGWSELRAADIYDENVASRAMFAAVGFRPDAPTRRGHSHRLSLDEPGSAATPSRAAIPVVRPADQSDLAFLVSQDIHVTPDRMAEVVEQGHVLVALLEGRRVGWLRWGLFWDEHPFMNMLCVLAEVRGRGIGRTLVDQWETSCRRAGHQFVLTSTLETEDAQYLYRHLGYTDAGHLDLPGEPREILLLHAL